MPSNLIAVLFSSLGNGRLLVPSFFLLREISWLGNAKKALLKRCYYYGRKQWIEYSSWGSPKPTLVLEEVLQLGKPETTAFTRHSADTVNNSCEWHPTFGMSVFLQSKTCRSHCFPHKIRPKPDAVPMEKQ